MDIASVIVDVPAKQTDREFDYRIPEKWNQVIKPGMRVIVPFGPRMVQGFVTGLKAKSDFAKLRYIKEPMDLEPILNDELLQLGDWLTKEAMCFKISALQAMLPAAMKAKYEKAIKIVEDKQDQLPPFIQTLFGKNDSISWKDVIEGENASLFQKEMQNGNLELVYNVKNRLNKKTIRVIKSLLSPKELKEMASAMSSHAKKQQELLQYFIEHQEPIR